MVCSIQCGQGIAGKNINKTTQDDNINIDEESDPVFDVRKLDVFHEQAAHNQTEVPMGMSSNTFKTDSLSTMEIERDDTPMVTSILSVNQFQASKKNARMRAG